MASTILHHKMIILLCPIILLLSCLRNSAFAASKNKNDYTHFQLQIYHFANRRKMIVNSLSSSTRAGRMSSHQLPSTSPTKATMASAFVPSRPRHNARPWHHGSPTLAPFPYPQKILFHHQLTNKIYLEKYRFLTSLLSSKESDDKSKESPNDDDDECSLQKLYQQVQEEDSEWYYETFSKLLGEEVEDPIDMLDCQRGVNYDSSEDKAANVFSQDSSKESYDGNGTNEKPNDEKDKLKGKVGVQAGKKNLVASEKNEDAAAEVSAKESAGFDDKNDASKKAELPKSLLGNENIPNESNAKPLIKKRSSPSLQQIGEVQEVMDDIVMQQAMPASDTKRGRVSDEDENAELEEHDEDFENDERGEISAKVSLHDDEDRITEECDLNKDLIPHEGTKPHRLKPKQTSLETNLSTSSKRQKPQPIVRIRNRFTDQYENITPLSTLQRMGYTEEEIRLLRPQVLELIVEDDIPKPRRGIPDRWTSSSRYDGYGEEEDEDDDDFGWEILVVYPKLKDRGDRGERQEMQRPQEVEKVEGDVPNVVANEVVTNEREEMKQKPPHTSITDNEEFSEMEDESHSDDGSSMPPAKPLMPSRRKEVMREERAPSQVSESWGPFSSSRIANDEKSDGGSQLENNQYDGTDNGKDTRDSGMDVVDDTDSSPRRRERRESIPQRHRTYSNDGEDDITLKQYSRKPSQIDGRKSRRPLPPPQRRRKGLVIDRDEGGNGDNPPPNKFWMDLPTFRDYLRTEAKLRLNILGPDWKESVLDESRWRFDLYKKWLYLLDDGVGENPLYTYGDRPRPAKQRRSRKPPPPPLSRRPIRLEELHEPKQPRQQKLRRPSMVDRDEDLYDYRQRRQRPINFDSSGGNIEEETARDTFLEPNRSYPKPTGGRRNSAATTGGGWKNFSDLEESLARSAQPRDSGRLDDSEEYYTRSRDGGNPFDEREQLEEEQRERVPPKRQRRRDQDDIWREYY